MKTGDNMIVVTGSVTARQDSFDEVRRLSLNRRRRDVDMEEVSSGAGSIVLSGPGRNGMSPRGAPSTHKNVPDTSQSSKRGLVPRHVDHAGLRASWAGRRSGGG